MGIDVYCISNAMLFSKLHKAAYDLVVIDESHNFRNGGQTYGDDDGERRPYRQDRDDRRPYGQEEGGRRKRNAPKPYGYDTFMSTKKRDTADAFWLKNTEVQKYDDEDSQD